MKWIARAGLARRCGALAAFAVTLVSAAGVRSEPVSIGDFQSIVDGYVAERSEPEMISGVAVYVSLGDPGPAIELFGGKTSLGGGAPITANTLFQIGSITKGFTGALILALEAEGKLDIDQTIGDWLPQYPAWKDVTIRRLLNMNSGLPNYSESPVLSRLWSETPNRHYTLDELIDFAYPSAAVDLPPNEGYFYSNTNYVLAGMIAERASGMAYKQAIEEKLFKPAGLSDTHYEPVAYPAAITDRMPSGYFNNPECGVYEPDCTASVLAPLIGRDMRTADVSWAGPAGGIVSSPREVSRWIRALFSGKVLPPQQFEELQSMISTATGQPIEELSAEDPRGFGLGLVNVFVPDIGVMSFYQGVTLGYRSAYLYSPDHDVLVAASTNSQPAGEDDKLVPTMFEIFKLAMQARPQ
jgi:D-alanyl-D-alanine carboxypeptidase